MKRRKTKYKHSFDTIIINNRWMKPFYSRTDNWVYLGISTRYFSPTEYEYAIHFFGIDIRIWMKREYCQNQL